MSACLARRVAKLEDRRRKRIHVPNVVGQFADETRAQAIARFCARYGGSISKSHRVLFVTQYQDHDVFAAKLKEQQNRVLAEARSDRPFEEYNQ